MCSTLPVIGVAKSGWELPQFRDYAEASLRLNKMDLGSAAAQKMLGLLRYVDGDLDDDATYKAMSDAVGTGTRVLFYLEVPPPLFGRIAHGIATGGLISQGCPRDGGSSAVAARRGVVSIRCSHRSGLPVRPAKSPPRRSRPPTIRSLSNRPASAAAQTRISPRPRISTNRAFQIICRAILTRGMSRRDHPLSRAWPSASLMQRSRAHKKDGGRDVPALVQRASNGLQDTGQFNTAR